MSMLPGLIESNLSARAFLLYFIRYLSFLTQNLIHNKLREEPPACSAIIKRPIAAPVAL